MKALQHRAAVQIWRRLPAPQKATLSERLFFLALAHIGGLSHDTSQDSSVSAKIEPNPILSYPLHTRPCMLSGTDAPVSSGFPVTSRPAKMW